MISRTIQQRSEYIKGLPLKTQMRQYCKSFPGRKLQFTMFSRREWHKIALMFRYCDFSLRESLCVISLWEQEVYQLESIYPKYPRNRNMPTFPALKCTLIFVNLEQIALNSSTDMDITYQCSHVHPLSALLRVHRGSPPQHVSLYCSAESIRKSGM